MIATDDQVLYLAAQAGLRARIEGVMTAEYTNLVLSGSSAVEIRDALTVVARTMVASYGESAATFAADWYNDMRATAGIPDDFTATEYVRNFDRSIDATVRRAVGGLFGDNPDFAGVVRAIVDKTSRYALDGARNTIAQNAYRDRRASGWQRLPYGATCDFCLLLVGRGGVYKKSTVNFRAHHNCDCGAAPSWDLNAKEVPSIAYGASERMQSLRNRAANGDKSAQRQLRAYRDRVASYIKNNQGEFAQLRQQYNLTPADSPAY